MRSISVTGEFEGVIVLQFQRSLESLADAHECCLALLRASALSTGSIAIATTGELLADTPGPETDSVEALSHVDDDAHDFTVVLVFEGFTNSGEHDV